MKVFLGDTVGNGSFIGTDHKEYLHCDYIVNPGQAYIDTKVIPNPGTGIKIKYEHIHNSIRYLLGIETGGDNKNYSILDNRGGVVRIWVGNKTGMFTSPPNGSINEITIKGGGVFLNGERKTVVRSDEFTTEKSIFLFNVNTVSGSPIASGYWLGKVFSCQIYNKEGLIIRDFIPVWSVENQEFGLYSEEFYGSSGKTKFQGKLTTENSILCTPDPNSFQVYREGQGQGGGTL